MRLDEIIGTVTPDNLVNQTYPPADVFHVQLKAGQGKLERGTLLSNYTSGGEAVIHGLYPKAATLNITGTTTKTATLAEANLDTASLKVYTEAGGTLVALTTDYTITYTSGTLTITVVGGGALASATSCYIVCGYVDAGKPKANCILTDDVDTGSSAGTALTATAYRTGHFNRNKLKIQAGYTLTDSDQEELRKLGILLSDVFSV